jgi:hypothetical protein
MTTFAAILAAAVVTAALLLALVATPTLVHRATVNGLNSRHLPTSAEPTEAERRAQLADDFTHYWSDYEAATRMPIYDPEYDWAAHPRGER